MKLDDYDLKILLTLQREGRMTKLRLAEAISLSPSACWERLLRLEQAGVIRGYQALVDLDQLVKTITVLVEVTLKRHQTHDFARFEGVVRGEQEIVECYATGGGLDYHLRIVTLDIESYQRLIDRLLEADIGIDRYFTYIVTKTVKQEVGHPLRHLLALNEEMKAP
jgi:Lrp/AsnC family transcriptional regulator, regulator of ectoine-degradation genes